ncbi:MAG: sugar ABC transporter substrate-binding protein [Actinomycetaceae bacterium]|nr:sugar ABC transporter substrate-binding protein [Actinomycetaceae bacterium]
MVKTKFRRAATVVVAAALAATSLAACSGSDEKATGSDGDGGATNITFMVLGASQEANDYLAKDAIPKFKEETGIDVTLQSSDWGSAFQKITTAAASKQMPDVMILGSIWTAPLAEKDALLPLDDYVAKWADKDQIFPIMLEDGVWKDTQYSVPYGGDLRAPIYRKDLLEQAGVDVNNLPTNWKELEAVAQKVKDANVCDSPIWWGIDKSIGLQQGFAQLMLQNGAQYWTADGKANFNDKPGKEALEFLVSTFDKGLSDYNLVYSGNGPRPLVAGQAAIGLGGMTEFANAEENDPSVKENLLVGPAIAGPSASEGSVAAWINKLAISKDSKHPDEAWKFIEFMLSKDGMSGFDEVYGVLPARADLENEDWLGGPGKALMEVAKSAQSQPPHPGMMQFGKEINQLLEPAVRGTQSVDDTLVAIDAKLDSFKG